MRFLVKQPKSLSSNYEIYKDDKVVGRLNCKGFIRSQATGEAGDRKWKFEQKGLFHTKVLIKDATTDKIIATFYSGAFSSGGILKVDGDEHYTFKSTSWWKSHYVWLTKSDKEVVRYRIGGLLKMNGEINVSDEVLNNTNTNLLLLLGLYQIKLINDAMAAAAA